MWRCALGLHRGGYVMVYDEYNGPEPVWLCDNCNGEYPDVAPLMWRIADWFWSTRWAERYLARELAKDLEREENERSA